jgi:tetratricopeptide (TPR) repeat protein
MIFKEIEDQYFRLFDIEGFDLTVNHIMEMAHPDSVFQNFGFYPVLSIGATGHDYLALRPLAHMPVERWPVMIYNEEEGQGQIFSTSYTRWFLSYGLGNEAVIDYLEEAKEQVLAYSATFDREIMARVIELLGPDGAAMDKAHLYAITEPGSYLAEYYALQAQNASLEQWQTYLARYPHDNKALCYLLERDMTPELAEALFHRHLRYDFKNTDYLAALLHKAGRFLFRQAPRPESPYWDMITRLAACESSYDYWNGGTGFFEAGTYFADQGDYEQALICYENAIYIYGDDEQELHEAAYEAAFEMAAQIGDPNLSAVMDWIREEGQF